MTTSADISVPTNLLSTVDTHLHIILNSHTLHSLVGLVGTVIYKHCDHNFIVSNLHFLVLLLRSLQHQSVHMNTHGALQFAAIMNINR